MGKFHKKPNETKDFQENGNSQRVCEKKNPSLTPWLVWGTTIAVIKNSGKVEVDKEEEKKNCNKPIQKKNKNEGRKNGIEECNCKANTLSFRVEFFVSSRGVAVVSCVQL